MKTYSIFTLVFFFGFVTLTFSGNNPTGPETKTVATSKTPTVNTIPADASGARMKVTVFSNPLSTTLTLQTEPTDKYSVVVNDWTGKKVMGLYDLNASNTDLDLGHLEKGVYFVTLISAGRRQANKLIIN